MTVYHDIAMAIYSQSILSGELMEASRRLLLARQHVAQWLDFLGVTDRDSLPSQRCSFFADICGGTGAISRWLLTANASISATVIDNDAVLLKLGRSLAATNKMGKRIEFRLSDAGSISMEDKSVDCSFIHGALHLLKDAEHVLAEMMRISRKRVVIFCADMNYVAPLERDECLTPFDEDIIKLERIILTVASRDYISMMLQGATLSIEQVPYLLDKLGCHDVLVRGIMEAVNFEELKQEEYQAYRTMETKELIAKVKRIAISRGNYVNDLIELYEKRQEFLIERHREGKRKYAWTGGPVVVWIGIKT